MKKITLLLLFVFTITLQGQNKLLSSVNQYLDGNGVWQNGQGSNYEYDNNNNLISETALSYWQTNSWQISYKENYTYNADKKVTEQVHQNWNTTTNKLENSEKTINTYTNGNITESIFQTWNTSSSSWINSDKNTLTWNSFNKPDGGIFYSWNGTQWVNAIRLTISYNTNNKITSILFEKWDGSNWVNSNKNLLSYNVNNHLTTKKIASWDDFNSIWKLTNQTDYVIDNYGNVTGENYTDASDNTKNTKKEYSYDTLSLMSSFVNPFNDKDGTDYLTNDPFVNKVLGYNKFSYNTTTKTYTNDNKTTYNYNSSIVLATDEYEITNSTISVFPNPTKDTLTFQNTSNNTFDKVIVSDITGKIILQQNIYTNQVNVQHLANGLYIIEAFSGDKKFTTKFIKE